MNKWLSLIVMTTLLFGAAYLAVATESGRSVLNSTAATREMLQQVDAMLDKNAGNPELLQKRAELATKLADAGETVAEQPQTAAEVKDVEYLLSEGALDNAAALEQEQAEARAAYYMALRDRAENGDFLSPSEKEELYASGILDGQGQSDDSRDHLDNTGGPDGFGYRWMDNLGGDTATYAWEDIVGAPGASLLTISSGTQDDGTGTVNLSFNFPFYGVNRTAIYPSTNGAIGMTSVTSYSNTCTLPSTLFPSGGIWPLWDDQHLDRGATGVSGTVSDSGSIWVKDEGNRVIVQWDSVGRFSPSYQHTYSYQAILYSSGKIKLQYKALDRYTPSTTFPSATIGIQQGSTAPANNYLTYACNTVADASQDTIRNRAVWFYQLFLNNDFSCSAVVSPSPLRVSPGTVMNIVGRFRNSGSVTQSSPIGYRFNGGANHIEATAVLATNATEDHDFAGTETAPMTVGDYELLLWSGLTTDQDHTNDTCRVTVQVRECYDETQTDAFTDAGTTCGAVNDWSNTCLGIYDGNEDYIYQWTTTTGGSWKIQLISATTYYWGVAVTSSCPPDSFNCLATVTAYQDTVSINCLALEPGTHYIVVDQYLSCGAYTLSVTPCTDQGRCCYNGGANCTDNGPYDCLQLGGEWSAGYTCAANPCPVQLQGTDDCPGPLLSVPMTVSGTTAGASAETGIPTCGTGYSTTALGVWYTVVGTGNTMTVGLCDPVTTWDTEMFVFCGGCDNLICIDGDDDGCVTPGLASTITWCSAPGTTYHILVTAFGSGFGDYVLAVTDDGVPCTGAIDCAPEGRCCYLAAGIPMCVDNLEAECTILGGQWDDLSSCALNPCPVGRCCYNNGASCTDNTDLECQTLGGIWTSTTTCAETGCPTILQGSDDCLDAVLVPAMNQQYVGTIVGYTGEFSLPTCASWYGVSNNPAGVWYKFLGTGNTMTVSLCDPLSDYDSEIGVFCGETCDALECVGSNDDYCGSYGASEVSFCSVSGAEYKLLVTAFSETSTPGNFALTITDDGTFCTPTVVCPILQLPCDPVIDLTAYVVTSGQSGDHLRLEFDAPQDALYKIWYSNVPNNDGNPDDGADANFILVTSLNFGAGVHTYDFPAGFDTYRYIVVTADCTPAR